jgi:hypothetical protein
MEVATLYNLCRIVDKSSTQTTFGRLFSHALYLETDQERYEISHTGEAAFRLARVISPRPKDERFFIRAQVPLAVEHLVVVSEGL